MNPRLVVLQPTAYCNIDCSYCYLVSRDDRAVMADEVLTALCEKLLARMPADAAPDIVWHAGEPTTVPIAWYERAHALIARHAPAASRFAMQSNGVAIDRRWVAHLKRTGTNIGLSIDGPQDWHDRRRRTRAGGPTWALATRGLRLLQAGASRPTSSPCCIRTCWTGRTTTSPSASPSG